MIEMGLFDKFRKTNKSESEARTAEPFRSDSEKHSWNVIITNESLRVEHPNKIVEEIRWGDIKAIWLENTDKGPAVSDIWLVLAGTDGGCVLPTDCDGYEDVYNIISKYPGFDFQAVIDSMTCADNARFILWQKDKPGI